MLVRSVSHPVKKSAILGGFSISELAIPRSYTPWFGTSDYLTGAEFADGDIVQSMAVDCRIDWIGGWCDAEAMYVDGSYPLHGMELLDNYAVMFEAVNGRGGIFVERDE